MKKLLPSRQKNSIFEHLRTEPLYEGEKLYYDSVLEQNNFFILDNSGDFRFALPKMSQDFLTILARDLIKPIKLRFLFWFQFESYIKRWALDCVDVKKIEKVVGKNNNERVFSSLDIRYLLETIEKKKLGEISKLMKFNFEYKKYDTNRTLENFLEFILFGNFRMGLLEEHLKSILRRLTYE